MVPHRLMPLTIAMMVASSASLAEDGPMTLKLSRDLTVTAPKSGTRQNPIFFDANRLETLADGTIQADGRVNARTLGESFLADWLSYDPRTDEIFAKGNVVFLQGESRLESGEMRLRLSDQIGEIQPARFTFPTDSGLTGRGGADRLLLQGRDRYQLEQTTYTTCPAGNDDWLLRTSSLDLDYITKVGQARDVRIEYLGMPILYAPWLDFALDQSRKTGFLTPTIGVSNDRGVEVLAPWYWNIAPNRDATVTPRLMSRRGVQIGGEFRYLEPDYRGELAVEALPNDNVTGEGRYLGHLSHYHVFNPKLTGRLLYDGVSDDAYFTDLSNEVNLTSLINLKREAGLSFDGGWWTGQARFQNFQTLQEPGTPIIDGPYNRLPQVLLNADKQHLFDGNLHLNMASELVHFDHESLAKAVGSRFYAYPSIEATFERTYGFIRPKVGWHYTRYELDRNPAFPATEAASRSLPIVSLDAGAYLERDWQLGGNDYLQTFEPRMYYVRIPAKDQSALPIFDSTVADLSYSQLFAENQFVGIDRINDANQITLGVTSRLLEPDSGLERLQVTVGQRYYFDNQQVTMPGYAARGSNVTDLLAQVSGQFTDHWRVDSGFQYNPDDGELARANLGATYRDGPGRLVNADLRYINERYGTGLNQLDLSWQWPIKSRWYGLGRLNYSFYDSSLVEGLLGFEYNAGCWSLRGVMQKLATTTNDSSRAIFLQLELHGLTKLGPNPLDVLKRSITGYTKSNELDLP